ncbi:ThiF family adenylyltransferase [Paenibacillus sp. CF384]|uniref:ThiF family adenylyltransferase n=1 Tax=Paenibacillus sp. CF384 TaxID=1884382 RepID=UPI000896307E|nr:ThiF family adenylyltransferase [Paenibacillus sp. CF384]SDW20782.1 ThiF family protein [Paenibacillus sp. CF384]
MKEQFIRNLGIMSEIDVDKLQQSTIAIAGCGCIGGFSAELLARMGIGRLVLADPDTFDVSNINRQCAATYHTVGMSKVTALREHLLAINPDLDIIEFPNGVTEANVAEFVQDADYVIDAIDYFAFHDAVALHRAARRQGKYIITAAALGFGATVLTFAPDGMTIEQIAGIPEDMPIEQLRGATFPPASYADKLPSYVTVDHLQEWLTNKTIPTISVGQALGPGVLVSQLVLHLLGRKKPLLVPEMFQLQFEL